MGRLKDDVNTLIELCNYDLFGLVHFEVTVQSASAVQASKSKPKGKGASVKITRACTHLAFALVAACRAVLNGRGNWDLIWPRPFQ